MVVHPNFAIARNLNKNILLYLRPCIKRNARNCKITNGENKLVDYREHICAIVPTYYSISICSVDFTVPFYHLDR